jgi:hypothetical protein
MEVRINIDVATARAAIVKFLRENTSQLNNVPASAVKFEFYQNASEGMMGLVTFDIKPEFTD